MITAPRGTKDILPQESYKWHFIENEMRAVAAVYGYRETRTPVFEHTELFLRGVGDTTDVVQKEMYTFLDKGERSVTLKPEGTAGVARSFIEHSLYAGAQPVKMYYLYCPVFRYEKPQAGRLREHHQFGVECFGAAHASADAEVIGLALELLRRVGVGSLALNINSIGCPVCRPLYHAKLQAALAEKREEMCPACRERFEKNPLRILDCKEERCREIVKGAPVMLNDLCAECADHFESLKGYLSSMGIAYTVNPFIVRGLDYYTKTVFEIISTDIGAQGTVCGGGRYDKLIEQVEGPPMPGVGFGMGMERLLLVMQNTGVIIPESGSIDVYFCTYGEDARGKAWQLAQALRVQGVKAEFDHMQRSMKAQMKYANKVGSIYVAVLGDDELAAGQLKLKHMATGEEQLINLDGVVERVIDIIGGR